MKKVVNKTRGATLVENLEIADNPLSRAKGLLGRSGLPDGAGLLIIPCNNIHMFFMRFAIDVVWVDRQNVVLGTINELKKWRVAFCFPARAVIELPPGRLRRIEVRKGDQLEIV
ncbi:MAG TPA: DUF192 domain-containing protein [Candidatus Brocadiia bacterium]|nr:DUF192 domain-containing protein [Candidatus Brocadiia bacterium]